MQPFWKLSTAGFAATAITYGPARMGFGLFLPEFRSAFSISTGTAGLISGLGFLGFLLGLLAAHGMMSRRGPRLPVVVGLLAASLGMGIVALAPNLPILALGVFLAMSSSGLSWTPFNDAINRQVEDASRPAALSIISTGTGLGIAAAGTAAIALSLGGLSWRSGWAAFAVAGALATIANWSALRPTGGSSDPVTARRWRTLLQTPAIPLYGIALSFGITTAIYISFAGDRIEEAGGIPGAPAGISPAVMFIIFGVCGLAGMGTGGVKAALSLPRLLGLLQLGSALSLLLVALTPTSWAGLIISAGLQGTYVMMMSAVMSFWSERLFPMFPSLGFTATLLVAAAGSVFGPVAAGFAAGAWGALPMFTATAAVSVLTAMLVGARRINERPLPTPRPAGHD